MQSAEVADTRKKLGSVQQQLRDRDELFEALRNLPEEEAADIFQRLRSGSDLSGFLSATGGRMHTRQQPSTMKAARAVSPPVSSDVEFELMVLHQPAYPKLEPLDLSFLGSFFKSPGTKAAGQGNSARSSDGVSTLQIDRGMVSPVTSLSPASQASFGVKEEPPMLSTLIGSLRQRQLTRTGQAAKTRLSSSLCDERLRHLQLEYWSRVPMSNEYAAIVISSWLETDHAFLGLFDADLFLEDLINRRLRFCSSFLVSSLLCLACVSQYWAGPRGEIVPCRILVLC